MSKYNKMPLPALAYLNELKMIENKVVKEAKGIPRLALKLKIKKRVKS